MIEFGDFRQIAYLTNNIEQSMKDWNKQGIGPFTWYKNVKLDALYKGEKSTILMDVGIAYRGGMQIELIQQTNDAISPYRTFFEQGRMGLHHLAYLSRDLDADLEKARNAGLEVICTIDAMIGRYAYFQDPAMPENIFEFLAITDDIENYWKECMEEARTWDGENPVRIIDLKFI